MATPTKAVKAKSQPGGHIEAAPNPPTGAGASGGVNSIAVSWLGSVGGASGYTAVATKGSTTLQCTSVLLACTISNVPAGSWVVTITATSSGGVSTPAAAGTVTVVDPANPPGMPTGVFATSGNTQAVVSWTAPANVGAGIAYYVVTTVLNSQTCTTSSTSCTVGGLTPGGSYSFKVTAVAINGAGSSLASLASPLVNIGPPSPPLTVGAVALANSAAVSWLGPLNGGAGVDHYTVTASPGGQTCTSLLLGCTVTGLTSGTTYTFSVVANGVAGTGDSTAAVTNAATPGPPGAPTNVTVTPGFLTATINWTPPAFAGAGIDHYVAYANPGLLPCGTLTATDTSCTMLSLLPATSYTVTVVAVGVGLTGTSVPSQPSAAFTAGPPSAPTAVTATPGSNAATVSWTAPATPGVGVTGYTVTASPGGATCAALTGTSCTVPLLTAGQAYTFTVVASSSAGPSPASDPSNSVRPGPPGLPTAVTAVAADSSATVSWTAPAATGAGVDHYTVTAVPGGATCTTTGTGCVVSGLTSGVGYAFTVVAYGATGTGNSLPSLASNIVVPGPPDAPTLVTATPGIGAATVSWVPPLVQRAGVTGYRVTASPGGATCTTSGTTCTVTGLGTGIAYTFSAVAIGPGGTSPATATGATTSVGPPGAPRQVQATALNGALNVSWNAPLLSTNLISAYIATATPGLHVCITVNAAQQTCTITGLDDGQQYTVSVVALGLGGTGSSPASDPSTPVVPGAPDAPTAVTATAGARSAAVSWTAPAVTRAGVDTYTVTASPGGATCTTVTTTCTVTGLVPGTAYTFGVVATGPGGASDPASTTTPVKPGPPGVPTGASAAAGQGTVTVTWTAPANPGGGILRYTVTALPGGATCTSTTTSCTFTGLVDGIGYTFTIVANGVAGTGDSAASTPTSLVAPGAPDPPTLVVAVAGNASANVSWVAPLTTRGGLSGYTVTASPGGATCTTATTACTVSGLTGGTAYTFTVTANGPGGTSTGTTTSAVTPGPPGAPTAVTATAAGTAATVSWTAPVNRGAGISTYTVTAGPGGATCTTATTSCTVSGLTGGTGYTFTVVANGIASTGSSPASTPSGPSTPGAPDAPTGVSATPGAGIAAVSWTAPAVTRAGLTNYTVTASPGGATCTTATTGCTVAGLGSGTAYTFTVVANGPGGSSTGAASAAVTPGPPGAPTGVTATGGNGTLAVAWTAPNNDGAGIDHYVATASPGGATCTSSGTACTITGLTGGVTYTVGVVAVGTGNTGASSAGYAGPSTPGAPDAPTLVVAVAGNAGVSVSWVAPLITRAGVTDYAVTASPGGATCTSSGLSCTVPGLTGGTAYTFTVVANGPGGTSPGTTTTAVTPGPPAPPTGVTVTGGNTTATVSWTAPANTGAGLAGYTVTATPGGASCVATTIIRTCVLTGLTNGTAYQVSVVANGVGLTGDSIASVAANVQPGPPDAPTAVTATAGSGAATVSWTAPATARAGVSSYAVTASPGGATCTTATTTCSVPGLSSGTAYTFTVVATGPGGTSPASAPSPSMVPGPPGAPTGVTVASGNGSATVSWTAPTNAGAGIAGYTVTASPGGATCTTTGLSCTVSGLGNGIAYTFAVVANGTGASGTSAAGTSGAAVSGPPDAPTLVVATPGNGAATVSWAAPLITRAGVTGYTVTASPGGATCTTSTTSCTVSGLTPGAAYTFGVVANGPGGSSPAGGPSNQVHSGPPGAPTAVTATAGSGSAVVAWTAPTSTGAGIAGYTATASPGGASCSTLLLLTCTVNGLTDGTAYTFTVTANGVGSTGTSPASDPSPAVTPGAPGAAGTVTAVGGSRSAVVSWTAPTDARAGVTGYVVTASPGGATCTTTGLSCTVTGLTGGTAYTFTVTATGPGGNGTASAPSNQVTAGPPGAPTGVSVTPSGGTDAIIAWTAPTNTGAGIDHYAVTALPGGATCATVDATTTTCTVTGLTATVGYLFTVVAVGSDGTGDSLPSATAALAPANAPDPPSAVNAVAGDHTATVSWTAPAVVRGGVTGYTVTASPGGASCATLSPSDTSCTVLGLTPGTDYTFTVVANGSLANSPASDASAAVAPGPPSRPGGVTVAAGSGQAAVSWTVPGNVGAGIDHYTATAYPGGASCSVSNATACTITGLTDGVPYTFSVIAHGVTGTGSSTASTPVAGVTGAPDAPTAVTATAGDRSAAVSWTAPTGTGAGITGYTVTAAPGGAFCVTLSPSDTTCTVLGLTPGTAYTFTVVANGPGGASPASAASAPVTAGPPSAPGAVTATGGDGTATVSWTASAGAGGAVDHYVVTALPGGETCSTSATTCVVHNLTNGVPYTFVVTAAGPSGTGSSLPTLPSPVVVPGAPDAVTGVSVAAGNGSVTVAWQPPGILRAGVTGYLVVASPGGGTCTTTGTSCVIAGLSPGQGYTFTVKATGPGGDAPVSAPTTSVEVGPPDAPTSVTATAGPGTATVTWTAPVNDGAGIDHYLVTAAPGGAVCIALDASGCTVTGLNGATGYTFTVVSVGVGNTGISAGAVTGGAINPGPPATPGAATAVAGNSSATVTWTAPTGGAPVDHYVVAATPGSAGCTVSALTCTVTGLTPGTSYTFTVTAVGAGAVGSSAPSAVSNAVLPGPPPPPTAVLATAGGGSAVVSWTPPAGGATVDHYVVTAAPGGATCTTSVTQCTITGLTNGTAYTFSVVAVGAGNTGTSDPAATSGSSVPGPPGPPTAVVATPGSGSATVTWVAPALTGAGVNRYTVTASPGGATCTATTGTSCTVTGLTGGTSYTFTVVANGLSGDSAASAPSVAVIAGPPGAPTDVTAVVGDGTADVSWTAPANQGAGIAQYTATASPGGQTCTSVGSSCTITGLSNGTAYTFSVVASGVPGTGDSAPGTSGTALVAGPPGAPTGATALPGQTDAAVSWTAPTGGGTVTGYTVTAAPDGATCTTTATTCTVTGLTSGTAYTFTVVANGGGGASAGAVTDPVTPGPPAAPDNVTAVVGNGEANVSWTPPSTFRAGVARYRAVAYPGGSACETAATSCVVDGLDNGVDYSFSVWAIGPGGASDASVPSSAVTPSAGLPGAPSDVTAAPAAGSGTAVVSWTEPLVTGDGITAYTVTASPGGATCTATGAATTSCTVSGLSDGTAYTFVAIATGPGGQSVPSTPSPQVITGPPAAPATATATPGDGLVAVSWTPGTTPTGGAATTGYTATALPGMATCTTTGATHCTITGLTNGVPYTVTVVATGPSGRSAPTAAAPAVPGAPRTPAGATAVASAFGATVSWQAAAGASAVTHYTVTAVPGGQSCTSTGTSCTITGLNPGDPVTFSVVAIGPGGSSVPASTGPVVPGPPTTPATVTASPGNGAATVTWDMPASTGGGLDVFTVTASPGGAVCTTSGLSCTVTGLTNGQPYTFTVVAHGSGATGSSPSSDPSSAVTPRSDLPGPPGAVTVAPGNGSATVSWTPPTVTGGGVDHYEVVSDDGQTCATTGTSCTVTGLTNGRTYHFVVRAISSVNPGVPGAGAVSQPVVPVATTPGVPTAVTAEGGSGSARVSWTAPTSGPAVTGYTVTAAPGGLTCTATGTTTCVVTGLTNGVAYTFTVVAQSAGGDSAASTASNTVIPAPPYDPSGIVPASPVGVTAVPGTAQATVSWTAGTGGPAVTGYKVTAVPGGQSCTTTGATTCTVTGLTDGLAYTFTVVAQGTQADSVPSAPSTAVYPSTPPGSPQSVTVHPRYSGLIVRWSLPASAGTGISHFTAWSHTGNGRCVTTSPTATQCTMFLPIGSDYNVDVVANGLHGRDSDSVPATLAGRPTFPPLPTWPPDRNQAGQLVSNLGVNDVTMRAGEPITLTASGFAPNSSVRFGAYVTSGEADQHPIDSADVHKRADLGTSTPPTVQVVVLGTLTVDTDGSVDLPTAAPSTLGDDLDFVAQGVAPDGSIRTLVLDTTPLGGTTPTTPTTPVTTPVQTPVQTPVRHGTGSTSSGTLATTGDPVASMALGGVLLLLLGGLACLAGRRRRRSDEPERVEVVVPAPRPTALSRPVALAAPAAPMGVAVLVRVRSRRSRTGPCRPSSPRTSRCRPGAGCRPRRPRPR
ncbi:fibronectin type III domain-containing protein [Dactylosporangium sp. CS-033363]|uniref:fibronectin type III domain-containing protein n=1 Tax=Dactylosporangium sp. CS-033363 TaxID=3239935 RepID=UPI003D913DC0